MAPDTQGSLDPLQPLTHGTSQGGSREAKTSANGTKSNAYCRHGKELVEGTQEDANAYSGQQDVQPLGHLRDAFPRDLSAIIWLTASLASLNGRVR